MDIESPPADRAGEAAFSAAIARARGRLQPATAPDRTLQALSAAAFFAICAMIFCAAAILAPSNVKTPPARASVR